MTNSEIIFKNRVFLMEQEIIKGIEGTSMTWSDEEGEREIQIPEEIKTFDEWKRGGYIVQKGQHAVARFQIWMPKKGKKKEDKEKDQDQDDEEKMSGFYKKVAFFFTADQVKPIKDGEKNEEKLYK